MTLQNIKQGLLLLFVGLWFPLLVPAQQIGSLSPSALPFGAYVTGLYQIEADNGSGFYLKEQPDGSLSTTALEPSDSGFYFWLVENVYYDYFQLYSASQDMKLMQINSNGSIQWTTNATVESSKLFFRMYTTGTARTNADAAAGIAAIGYITTHALSAGYGNADCKCNFLTVGANARFRIHNSGIQGQNYRPIAFEKTDNANVLGTIQTDTQNNLTRITQEITNPVLPQNFVSSNFFVKGFGKDDFQITIAPDTEGYIGFIDYTHHHYTKEVYRKARPEIGIKVQNNVISLVYLSGEQPLPYSPGLLGREVATGFVTGTPFTLGFQGQNALVVTQNGVTHVLERAAPAELFFNRSVTQSARMLVQLVQGEVELAYTTKNYLINSENDTGTDTGSTLVSTHALFPYNEGGTFINTFDWQQTQWPVRYVGEGGTVTANVFSPFYNNSTEFSGIAAGFDLQGNYVGGEDFAGTEGWELIKANLGYNANGTIRPQAPSHPYIIFYNRVSGTLRVFVYTNNEGEANQLTVSLSAMGGTPTNQQGYVPKLWGSLQQFASLDQVEKSQYSRPLPFYSASGRSWYVADFVMEYDPCIAFFESTLNLQVYKTTQGTLTMIGRLEGGSIPAGTPEYANWQNQRENFLMGVMDNNFGNLANTLGDITMNQYNSFDLLDFQTEVSGTLTGATIEDWEKEKAKIEWEASETIAEQTIYQGMFGILQGLAQVAGGGGIFSEGASNVGQGIATIAIGVSQINQGGAELRLAHANKLYYDNIKDKIKQDDQKIVMQVPPPRPQVVFGELALKGTLTIQTSLIPEDFIAIPGGLNSNTAPEWYVNGSRGSKPLYNRPMGNFTLLKQPEFGVGIVKGIAGQGKAYLKIKEKPYFAYNNTAMGKIEDVLALSIQVQTLDVTGKVKHNATGQSYTNLFNAANSKALPGGMEISNLVDWDQINANIAALVNPTDLLIEDYLDSWIKVSYEVWSLTLTNLKARNLSRVFANGDQYFEGNTGFKYNTSTTGSPSQLIQEAENQANTGFPGYNFSDNAGFGTNYHLYHTQYDQPGDPFYTAMNTYCNALSAAQNTGAKNSEETQNTKGAEVAEEDPIVEELTVPEPGLTVYPNPTQYEVNFRLVSGEAGKARITLYDLQGKRLISTTDTLDGSSVLQGRVNIASLPAGIYILEVELPGGRTINKKIMKQ